MFCLKFGNEVNKEDKYCMHCGKKIHSSDSNESLTKKNKNKQEASNANLLCILSLIFVFGVPIISSIISVIFPQEFIGVLSSCINGLSPIAGLILMITARVKYPKNKFGKILMWTYIIMIVLSIVLFAIAMISC